MPLQYILIALRLTAAVSNRQFTIDILGGVFSKHGQHITLTAVDSFAKALRALFAELRSTPKIHAFYKMLTSGSNP